MTTLRTFVRDLSIQYKIAWIVLVTSGAALLIAGASLVTFDVRSYKSALVNDLSVKADIIAANSTAALAFEDYDSARQTLSGLVHEYKILVAYLLSAEGLTFATYTRADVNGQHRKPVLREEGFFFADDFLAVRRPIHFDGEVLGHIYIEADLGYASLGRGGMHEESSTVGRGIAAGARLGLVALQGHDWTIGLEAHDHLALLDADEGLRHSFGLHAFVQFFVPVRAR